MILRTSCTRIRHSIKCANKISSEQWRLLPWITKLIDRSLILFNSTMPFKVIQSYATWNTLIGWLYVAIINFCFNHRSTRRTSRQLETSLFILAERTIKSFSIKLNQLNGWQSTANVHLHTDIQTKSLSFDTLYAFKSEAEREGETGRGQQWKEKDLVL